MEDLLSDADLVDLPVFKEATAKEIAESITDTIAIEIKEDCIYLSSNSNDLLYKGSVSEICHIFEGKKIICYDGKALWHVLDKAGADCSKITFLYLMLYEYALNPGSGNAGISSLLSMFVGKTIAKDIPATPFMSELEEPLKSKIAENGLETILFDIELPLIHVLASTEKIGFKINPALILEFGEALGELSESLASRIYMQAGEIFNINSPKQLGVVLYEKMGLNGSKKKGKTGYSTDA
jgi:DNA polymerase-1